MGKLLYELGNFLVTETTDKLKSIKSYVFWFRKQGYFPCKWLLVLFVTVVDVVVCTGKPNVIRMKYT